jgi:hypothetical protein
MKMIKKIPIMLLTGGYLVLWLLPGLSFGQTEQKRTTTASGGQQINGNLLQFVSVGVPVVGQLVHAPHRTDIGFQEVPNTPESPELTAQFVDIAENPLNGTVIYTLKGFDPNGQTLLFSLLDDPTSGGISVDGSMGNVTIVDSTFFDYETHPVIEVGFGAFDGQLSTTSILTISLSDVLENRAPVIADQNFSIAENLAVNSEIATIVASDEDGDALTYALEASADASSFTINASTGLLSQGSTVLDFETQFTYTFSVRVSDGDEESSATMTVHITDINESPAITSAGFDIPENTVTGTVVDTVLVSDPEDNDISYSIVSGNTDQKFEIDALTGEISVVGGLSTELVQSYTLGIQVSDGTLTTIKEIQISITDVNEAPVLADVDFSVEENSPKETIVGQLTATDPEGTTVSYHIVSGNDHNLFDLDTLTGVITVADPTDLDFEVLQKVDLVIKATDGELSSDEVTISIFIQDVAESRPPVAIVPGVTIYHLLGDPLVLEGFDPDGDPIVFEIVEQPAKGTLTATVNASEWIYTSVNGLSPGISYTDSVKFKVVENTAAGLESEVATLKFKFQLFDRNHKITSLDITTSDITLGFTDQVVNPNYTMEINYFDLSDPLNVTERSLYHETVNKNALTIDGDDIIYSTSINDVEHSYLFSGNNVFVTALLTTVNGLSSFKSFIFNSSSGSRIEASSDGLFFAFGSKLTLRENDTDALQMLAVELGDYSLADAAVELLSVPSIGKIGTPVLIESTDRIYTWEAEFESTLQVGGTDSIQFRVYHPDRQVFDTAWAKITVVDVNDQPQITSILDQQIKEDSTLELSISIFDPDSDFNVSVTSSESTNVPVIYENGILTITPLANYHGNVSISVIAEEKNTADEYVDFDRFDIEITPVNDAPIITAVNDQEINEDKELQIVLSATDVDNANAVFVFNASSNKPSKVKTSMLGNTLTIKPAPNVNGEFEIYVTADDQTETETAQSIADTIKLSIASINDRPEIRKTLATQNLLANFPSYSINLSAYFTDVESDDSLIYSTTGNSSVLITIDKNILNVDLTEDFIGVEDITITASDGELSVSQSVTFVVSAVSSDVTVSNAIADLTLQEDFNNYVLDVSEVYAAANITDPIFNYQVIGASYLTAEADDEAKTVTFTPTANFNGVETIYLLGTVNGKTAYDEFVITVEPVNDAPELTSIDDQTTNEDKPLIGLFVGANDIDNALSDLTLSITTSNETLVDSSGISVNSTDDGFLLDITSANDKSGSLDFYVVLSDGLLQQKDTFNLKINPVNDAPRVSDKVIDDAIEDQPYQLTLIEFFNEPDEEPITVEVTQKPAWLLLAFGVLNGTPSNDQVGDWTVRLKATDTTGNSVASTIEFAVTNVNDAPVLNNSLSDVQVFQNSSWNYEVPSNTFNDIDLQDQLQLSFAGLPGWVQNQNGKLSGNPVYSDIGSSEVIVIATDNAGASVSDTFSLAVIFTDYDVEVILDSLTVCADSEVTFNAEGAYDYNWFESDSLIQDGGDSLIYTFKEGVDYFVQAKDEDGRTSSTRHKLPIHLIPLPEISIEVNGDVFSVSPEVGLTFQWYLEGNPVEGATSSSINATSSGGYYVLATNEAGCNTESSEINYALGLDDIKSVLVYPNPATKHVTIGELPRGSSIEMIDVTGRQLYYYPNYLGSEVSLAVDHLKSGIYFIKVTKGSSQQVIKMIKQ